MAKKLFKKKSFWAKLSIKSKVGLLALVVALVGAAAAYALSLTDASLQSHASLTCDTSCKAACGGILSDAQGKTCLTNCQAKCQAVSSSLPQVCTQMSRYVNLMERRKGLTKYQLGVVNRVLKNKGEDVATWGKQPTTDNFAKWYEQRCTPQASCDRNWSQVISKEARTQSPTDPRQKMIAQIPYYWPDSCKGYQVSSGQVCGKSLVPLTSEESAGYKAWLNAGKPTVKNICPMPDPNARPTPTSQPKPTGEPGDGCYYQKVICVKEPCDAIKVCPSPSQTPTSTAIPKPSPVASPYVCPESGYIDCMPGVGKTDSRCSANYQDWAKQNCPNFKVAY